MTGERPQPNERERRHWHAVEQLNQAINNPEYEQLARPTALLTEDQLPARVRQDDSYPGLIDAIGWPSSADEGTMTPRYPFANDDEFATALIRSPFETTASGERPVVLNNLIHRLHTRQSLFLTPEQDAQQQPTGGFRSPIGMDDPYKVEPVVYRAMFVAPELMDGLRYLLNNTPEGTIDDFNDNWTNLTKAVLQSPDGPTFKRAAHLAYRLMGRLVKPTDKQTQGGIMFGIPPSGLPLVANIHDQLIS